jgi:uncharacterized protein YneR
MISPEFLAEIFEDFTPALFGTIVSLEQGAASDSILVRHHVLTALPGEFELADNEHIRICGKAGTASRQKPALAIGLQVLAWPCLTGINVAVEDKQHCVGDSLLWQAS